MRKGLHVTSAVMDAEHIPNSFRKECTYLVCDGLATTRDLVQMECKREVPVGEEQDRGCCGPAAPVDVGLSSKGEIVFVG